jgi:acyl dehydratase
MHGRRILRPSIPRLRPPDKRAADPLARVADDVLPEHRFSAPVFPGETIRTEVWRDGDIVSFRARAVERDVISINNGRAEVRT